MSRGIRFSVDTERTLEHLEQDLFASSRSRALPREKGKSAERRNAFFARPSSRTKRFFLLRRYFLASSCTLTLSERWIRDARSMRGERVVHVRPPRGYAVRSVSSNRHRTPLKRRRTRATAATE